MFCINCGHQLPVGANFCPKCGHPVKEIPKNNLCESIDYYKSVIDFCYTSYESVGYYSLELTSDNTKSYHFYKVCTNAKYNVLSMHNCKKLLDYDYYDVKLLGYSIENNELIGYFGVKIGSRWALYSSKGRINIHEYQDISRFDLNFSSKCQYCRVKQNGKYGIVDFIRNEVSLPCEYDEISNETCVKGEYFDCSKMKRVGTPIYGVLIKKSGKYGVFQLSLRVTNPYTPCEFNSINDAIHNWTFR